MDPSPNVVYFEIVISRCHVRGTVASSIGEFPIIFVQCEIGARDFHCFKQQEQAGNDVGQNVSQDEVVGRLYLFFSCKDRYRLGASRSRPHHLATREVLPLRNELTRPLFFVHWTRSQLRVSSQTCKAKAHCLAPRRWVWVSSSPVVYLSSLSPEDQSPVLHCWIPQ